MTALARALTRAKTSVASAVRRASTRACPVAQVRSSRTASCPMDPVGPACKPRIICSQKVVATAPIRSRPSPAAMPSCSQAVAVSRIVASSVCITPCKAVGERPICDSRRRRTKNALIVASPTPRVSPKIESVATTPRVRQRRPSAGAHHQDAGAPPRRALAGRRRCPRLVARPGFGARRRTRWGPLALRRWKTSRLVAHNPLAVWPLQGDCTRGGMQCFSVHDRHPPVPP